ncbi:MAG: FMN-binding protein, partial [Oscillospiraceae bacterium]|nr:FMN-binding protein [Oscillospiraceae bacterium]
TETEPEESLEEVPQEDNLEEVPPEEAPPEEPQPEPEPEPVYMYRNGVYSTSAYGYDGDVFVDVTIENDVIISITARTEESDPWYFERAEGSVIAQILASQDTSVDAVSGATYSSNAIMSAVQQALNAARN